MTAYVQRQRRLRRYQNSSTTDSDDWSTRSNGRSFGWHLPSTGVTQYPQLAHPHSHFFPRPRIFTWIDTRYVAHVFNIVAIGTHSFFSTKWYYLQDGNILIYLVLNPELHCLIFCNIQGKRGWDKEENPYAKGGLSFYSRNGATDGTYNTSRKGSQSGGRNDWPSSSRSTSRNSAVHILPHYKPFYKGHSALDFSRKIDRSLMNQ